MRGSPSAPVAVNNGRLNDWTPRLFPRGESLNKKSWGKSDPNTWLMEPTVHPE